MTEIRVLRSDHVAPFISTGCVNVRKGINFSLYHKLGFCKTSHLMPYYRIPSHLLLANKRMCPFELWYAIWLNECFKVAERVQVMSQKIKQNNYGDKILDITSSYYCFASGFRFCIFTSWKGYGENITWHVPCT